MRTRYEPPKGGAFMRLKARVGAAGKAAVSGGRSEGLAGKSQSEPGLGQR